LRETALLIPEATPARLSGTEFITVVVSGATQIAMPRPSTTTAGKKVVQYIPPTLGKMKRPNPAAATRGPITSGSFAPTLSTSPPTSATTKRQSE
jgi:hypothetical protein